MRGCARPPSRRGSRRDRGRRAHCRDVQQHARCRHTIEAAPPRRAGQPGRFSTGHAPPTYRAVRSLRMCRVFGAGGADGAGDVSAFLGRWQSALRPRRFEPAAPDTIPWCGTGVHPPRLQPRPLRRAVPCRLRPWPPCHMPRSAANRDDPWSPRAPRTRKPRSARHLDRRKRGHPASRAPVRLPAPSRFGCLAFPGPSRFPSTSTPARGS